MTQPTRSEATQLRVKLARSERVWGANPNKQISDGKPSELLAVLRKPLFHADWARTNNAKTVYS